VRSVLEVPRARCGPRASLDLRRLRRRGQRFAIPSVAKRSRGTKDRGCLIKRLLKGGWYLDRQSGSHRQYRHDTKRGLYHCRRTGNQFADWDVQEHHETGGMEIVKYAFVVERGPSSWGAYVPDLPGCVAVAKSYAAVSRMIKQAALYHVEGLVAAGLPVPKPS
jgi:predicted RNase H-like HicB family nuclease